MKQDLEARILTPYDVRAELERRDRVKLRTRTLRKVVNTALLRGASLAHHEVFDHTPTTKDGDVTAEWNEAAEAVADEMRGLGHNEVAWKWQERGVFINWKPQRDPNEAPA